MNESPYKASSEPKSPQYLPVFPSRRVIVLLAILFLLVVFSVLISYSFASQAVPGLWHSGEYFSERGKNEVPSIEGTID
ncbi:MAG: hypothetical protein KDA69_20450 [Planctomycetaceae bacterium]|nr:hypothetical protein [Planctomycetaceae bacterium]